ncbi:MAG: hypothetical protein ACSW8E_02585 [Clostridia bacterium]
MMIKSIEYDEALRDYMAKKGMSTIAVQVASSEHSDLEVTELYIRLVSDSMAAHLKEKKRFRAIRGELGEVLLPPYKLEYDETIRFSLKKIWIFHSIKQTGIRL